MIKLKIALLIGFSMLSGVVPLLADTQVISPGNMGNWSFASYDSNGNLCGGCGSGAMVFGPGTPPLGVGSANLQTSPGGGDGASAIGYVGPKLDGIRLDSLTSLSYSTYMHANNGQQFPYLKLWISTTGAPGADDALFFEPPYQTPSTGDPSLPDQGATAMDTWQTWNVLGGSLYNQLGPSGPGTGAESLSDYLAANPNATIVAGGASGFDLRLTVGFASDTDNFDGNVDSVTIGTSGGGVTTFDFEPVTTPEPASLLLLATLVAGLGWGFRKKRFTV